jgi:hypothetical protein
MLSDVGDAMVFPYVHGLIRSAPSSSAFHI